MNNRETGLSLDRREFLVVVPCALLAKGCAQQVIGPQLKQSEILGGLKLVEGPELIKGASWYQAAKPGDGIEYRFPAGAISQAKFLTADMLLDGKHMIVFYITLQEGEEGRKFLFRFSGLNQCSFRMRFPLDLVDQNRWAINREGAFLKPRVYGDRVDLTKVDRITFTVFRKSPKPARWCMTDLTATEDDIELISDPLLPKGPLLDELGQSTIHDWPAKSKSLEEVVSRIRSQLEDAPNQEWPGNFTRWGGWKSKTLTEGSGFFAKHHDGERWWLVDPSGHAFWSTGADCMRLGAEAWYGQLESALTWLPEPEGEFKEAFDYKFKDIFVGNYFNYLTANMIRSFGPDEWYDKWAEIIISQLRRLRFNTVGNWSDWEVARKVSFPYVRPMMFRNPERVKLIYRSFPDVFDPNFQKDADDYAQVLQDTVDDPALIGYFLMNEPTWGFSSELPAAGMLFNTPECHTRGELANFLKTRHSTNEALSAAWKLDTSFEQIAAGVWTHELTEEANQDLEAFSVRMTDVYFKTLSAACRKVDPNHLNLGMRWQGLPPMWAVEGMKSFDVFSINCYMDRVPRDVTDKINELLSMPVIIGEWHFGALDVGLPSSGIGHLHNQEDRAKAYRVYIEDAAANPNCVGTHWFTVYDESALGRFDGENYNIGFLDVCNRPYEELGSGAIASHERIYEVASGQLQPFNDVPEYLPKLF